MAHVDDGQLNALLDGELSPGAARDVEAHVATCAECARRLDEARAFLSGAGELLAVLTPPPRTAEPVKPAAAVLIAKTSREIAINVDGRTEMTSAIRPVFAHEVPPAPPRRSWKLPGLEKLAWAASLVLCLGVGYLTNEVYHLKQQQTAGRTDGPTDVAVNSAAPATSAAPAERRLAEPDAGPSGRRSVSPSAGPSVRPPARPSARAPNTSPARTKPPGSKPAPAFAQPRPEQIASNRSAPAAAAPPLAAPSAGALGDVAGVAAPNSARAASGAGVRAEGRANAADEAAVAPSALAVRSTVPSSFQRVGMEEANRRLSGSLRVVDGMIPSRVEIGPGRLVPGADPDREVVRLTYTRGTRPLVLDQQLGDTLQGVSMNGLMPGDTLVTALGSNGSQVRWLDHKVWLSLTGGMPADSVRALLERIR